MYFNYYILFITAYSIAVLASPIKESDAEAVDVVQNDEADVAESSKSFEEVLQYGQKYTEMLKTLVLIYQSDHKEDYEKVVKEIENEFASAIENYNNAADASSKKSAVENLEKIVEKVKKDNSEVVNEALALMITEVNMNYRDFQKFLEDAMQSDCEECETVDMRKSLVEQRKNELDKYYKKINEETDVLKIYEAVSEYFNHIFVATM